MTTNEQCVKYFKAPLMSEAKFGENPFKKWRRPSQLAFTCTKSTIEALDKDMKYVQRQH